MVPQQCERCADEEEFVPQTNGIDGDEEADQLDGEQARRLEGRPATANAVCPGFVPMTASDSATGVKRVFMRTVLARMPFAVSVDAAAGSLAFMATDPSLDGVTGAFYGEQHPIESSPESHDAAKATRFWALAEALTGFTWPA